MQRRAFELTAVWDDVEEKELDPPALDRLAEILVPALVLVGAHDLDAIEDTARRVSEEFLRTPSQLGQTPLIFRRWSAPDGFFALLRDWLTP